MAPIAARASTGGSRACRQMSSGPSPGLRASTAVSTESSASMKSIRTPSTCRKMTTVATAGTATRSSKHPGNMCGAGGNQDVARSGRLGQDSNRYNDNSEARHLTTVRIFLVNEPAKFKLPP